MAVATWRRQRPWHWVRARGCGLRGPGHGQTGQGPVTNPGHFAPHQAAEGGEGTGSRGGSVHAEGALIQPSNGAPRKPPCMLQTGQGRVPASGRAAVGEKGVPAQSVERRARAHGQDGQVEEEPASKTAGNRHHGGSTRSDKGKRGRAGEHKAACADEPRTKMSTHKAESTI